MKTVVQTDWLLKHLHEEGLCILDATWFLPTTKRQAWYEYNYQHIPGAKFFDLDKISDPNSTLPHMLPSADQFSAEMSRLGITNQTRVVCYDALGIFSAPRCWWMFKAFGHQNVWVLDGGLKKWMVEGKPISDGEKPIKAAGRYKAVLNSAMVRSMADVSATKAQVVDARSPTRFRGEEAEPRPGVKPGHIPGSINLHYAKLVTLRGLLYRDALLRSKFTQAGIDLKKPIITSCGSGVTAAIITMALTEMGHPDHALYDGSWAEWGASGRAIEAG
jgi:thiosulfate/3-mercaptopyruvate sulfurtransferase